MKTSLLKLLALTLLINPPLAWAGFTIEGSADGVPLGRPARPHPAPGGEPATLPATPVTDQMREKMTGAMRRKFEPIIKCELGEAAWEALGEAGRETELDDQTGIEVTAQYGAGEWGEADEATRDFYRDQVANKPALRARFIRNAQKRLGCLEWDAFGEGGQERRINEKVAIELIGEAAYDALDEDGQTAARDQAIEDKIQALRCNVKIALELIACIPAIDSPDLSVPSGADVADCLRKTWEKGRLCVDFISRGAFGSIKPNCAGKEAGCDPDNNPINIALTTFPCRKTDKPYDPELYTLVTTLYHEGIHALQDFPAKSPPLPEDPTPEQLLEAARELLDRYNKASQNECETHGAENALIEALCDQLDILAAGDPTDAGGNDFIRKVLDCFNDEDNFADEEARTAAIRALKQSLRDNKASNDGALACYQEYKNLFARDDLSVSDKFREAMRIRWIARRLNGRLILAESGSNVIRQFETDPETQEEIPQNTTVPFDTIHDLIITESSDLLVMGAESEFGDGVIWAFSDLDGDGLIDPDSGREILRDFSIFEPTVMVPDLDGRFLAVNLFNGAIFSAFRFPDPVEFDTLPNALEQVGQMETQPQAGGFVSRVILSEDGRFLSGLPFFFAGTPPFLAPSFPLPVSEFNELEGGFLPLPTPPAFESVLFPPVIVGADGQALPQPLPVPDPFLVINQFVNSVEIHGIPNGAVGLFIPPLDLFLGPVPLNEEGIALINIPQPLQPGFPLILTAFDPLQPTEPPFFQNPYLVRDATPILIDPLFLPPNSFDLTFVGIPGMEYELLFGPELLPLDPLNPLGGLSPLPLPPVAGGELELQLQGVVIDPLPQKGFFAARPILLPPPDNN